jgi:hypothetical protein
MAIDYDDPDEMARQQMAENLARIAESSQTPQEPEAPDVATINRLAPEKYTIRPELADYISRMREGVNDRAIEEKYRNQTWDTFDKLGDIRANTYGLKNVRISSPDTTAQTEAANVNKLTQAAELGDITRHGKLRDDLALALARKRGGNADRTFLKESSYVTKQGAPVLVHNDPTTGVTKFYDIDKNPVSSSDIVKSGIYAEQLKDTREKAAKIGMEAKDYVDADTAFNNIDRILKQQIGDKFTKLEDVKIRDNVLTGPEVEGADLAGVTIPFLGRKSSTLTDPGGRMNALDSQRKLLSTLWTKIQSGLTVSDKERATIEKVLEQGDTATEGEIIRGLQTFKDVIKRKREAVLNQYGPEAKAKHLKDQQIISAEQANAIPSTSTQVSPQEQKPKEVIREAPNGRKAIFNADTKEFLRYAD